MRFAVLLFLCLIAALAQVPGQIAEAGKLKFPRSGHTATLLPDGRVLLTGGVCAGVITCPVSAEIFNPANGESVETGPLQLARKGHSAVLLSDGRVLLTGGDTPMGGFGRAELFDPKSGASVLLDAKISPRNNGIAHYLSNGDILLACGGEGTPEILKLESGVVQRIQPPRGFFVSCQVGATLPGNKWLMVDQHSNVVLVDPIIEEWHASPGLASKEWDAVTGQSVTALPNGKVMIAGGFGSWYIFSGLVDSFETYDPATKSMQTQNLRIPRHQHAACLSPDGVLLSGAMQAPPLGAFPSELIDLDGGASAGIVGALRNRAVHTCTLLNDGSILIAGGEATGTVDRYWPIRQWPETHIHAAVPVAGGKALELYVSGPLEGAQAEPIVWVGGKAAALLYSSPTQINVLVPEGLSKGDEASIVFRYLERNSNTVSARLN